MKDRQLACSIAAGFAALSCGILSSLLDLPLFGLFAGGFGFVAAIFATAIAGRAFRAETLRAAVTEDRDQLRGELAALAAIFADEATAANAGSLALAPTIPMETAVDTVSGLLEQQFFKVLAQQRVAAARRQLQPVAIVMFEIDGLDGSDRATCDRAIAELGGIIVQTLRESDAACRIGDTMAVAILEDTAEAGAVWAAERIRGTLHQTEIGGTITVSAGIACYPIHALSAPELIDRAGCALEAARSHGRDRLEIATPVD